MGIEISIFEKVLLIVEYSRSKKIEFFELELFLWSPSTCHSPTDGAKITEDATTVPMVFRILTNQSINQEIFNVVKIAICHY